MGLNILLTFEQELLEKPEDMHLRAHITSAFVAINNLTKTSRVDWTFAELVAQHSLFTSSSSSKYNFFFGFCKETIDFVSDWCFLPKHGRERSVGNKEWQ